MHFHVLPYVSNLFARTELSSQLAAFEQYLFLDTITAKPDLGAAAAKVGVLPA
jgi:hypothetical protein